MKQKITRLNVYAPVDGFVIAKEAEVVQYVLPATPILKMVDPTTLWVGTKIDERVSAQVKQGQSATIRLRSQPEKTYLGKVKRIDAITDPVTLERKINVSFDQLPQPFYINEQARVEVNIQQYQNVTKIPLSVVVNKGGKLGLWVKKQQKAHFIEIKKMASNEHEMAIKTITPMPTIIVPNKKNKVLTENMRIYP